MLPVIKIRRHQVAYPWSYRDLEVVQNRVAARVREGGPGALILSEVRPVITVGRRTPESDLLLPSTLYESQGIELVSVLRGGRATYHGPGQWVAFAVDSLERLTGDRRGVRKAVEGLLESAHETARIFGVDAEIRTGDQMGVWSSRGKIASVGVQIVDGVLQHGLCLNGFATPKSFAGIRPCGLDAAVDFVLRDRESIDREFERLGEVLQDQMLERLWGRSFARISAVDEPKALGL